MVPLILWGRGRVHGRAQKRPGGPVVNHGRVVGGRGGRGRVVVVQVGELAQHVELVKVQLKRVVPGRVVPVRRVSVSAAVVVRVVLNEFHGVEIDRVGGAAMTMATPTSGGQGPVNFVVTQVERVLQKAIEQRGQLFVYNFIAK